MQSQYDLERADTAVWRRLNHPSARPLIGPCPTYDRKCLSLIGRYPCGVSVMYHWEIPFLPRVGHALASGSDAAAGPVRRPRFPISEWRQGSRPDATSRRAVDRPAAAPATVAASSQDRLRSQLDGLSTSADQKLGETEDALVAFMEQQASATHFIWSRGRNSSRSTSSAA